MTRTTRVNNILRVHRTRGGEKKQHITTYVACTDLKGFVARVCGQPFRAVQTETDVRVSVGVASAVRRTGRRRVYRFRVALEIS